MSMTVGSSVVERFGFWNGGYTVTFVTLDDPHEDHPVRITVLVEN